MIKIKHQAARMKWSSAMKFRLGLLVGLLSLMTACSQDNPIPVTPAPLHDSKLEVEFTITFENLSQTTTLASTLSPVTWAVAQREGIFFAEGRPAGRDLERLAEDGQPDGVLNSV